MKNLMYLVLGILIIFCGEACHRKRAKNYNTTPLLDAEGITFVKNAIEGGLTEIKASGFAITNSENQRVISYAKMIISDHSGACDELRKIEADKMINTFDTINSAHQNLIAEIAKKNQDDFDKSYMAMMVSDHERAIKLFTGAVSNPEPDLNSFAIRTLPKIKMHLDSAQAIFASLK